MTKPQLRGPTNETSARSGNRRCHLKTPFFPKWRRQKNAACRLTVDPSGPVWLGSAAPSHWSVQSLCCHLSRAPPEPGPASLQPLSSNAGEAAAQCLPLARENPSLSAVWCRIRVAARQRALRLWSGLMPGGLCDCCVARSCVALLPGGELNSPNNDARPFSSFFSFSYSLRLLPPLLYVYFFCWDGVSAAVTLISPVSAGVPEVHVPNKV